MNINDRVHIRTIFSAAEATEYKIPKAVLEARDQAVSVSERIGSLGSGSMSLAEAVTAAMVEKRDPADCPVVQRIVTANALSNAGVRQVVEDHANQRLKGVLSEYEESIAAAWAKPFSTAAETLQAAHRELGRVSLDDSASILNKGGSAAETWVKAQSAARTIHTIDAAWVSLASMTHEAPNKTHAPLRLASIDLTTWNKHELGHSQTEAWDLVLAGLELSLPTYTEYRQRIQTLDVARAAAQQRAEQAASDRFSGRQVPA